MKERREKGKRWVEKKGGEEERGGRRADEKRRKGDLFIWAV